MAQDTTHTGRDALISASELSSFVASVFASRGMSPADAATLADVLVWADLRGIDSHGVERLPSYLAIVERGEMNLTARPRLDDLAPAMFRIDAERAAGPVPMMMAMQEAVTRAAVCGVAMGVVRRSAHTGAVGYYVQWAARRGFAAMVFGSGPPLMAYHGARVASLSTSPLAIGVPGGPSGALVLDMASAVAANGKLKQAQREGKPIPEGWALDKDGRPTTDAGAAAIALPIGGPKGAGLGLMFECLTSIMAGAPLLATMMGPGNKPYHMQSEMVVAVDVSKFRALEGYAQDVAHLADLIRGLPRADEDQPIRMPGERGEEEARRREENGVPLSPRLARQLAEIAERCGVAPPAFRA
ncbi:MAG: Ureidoglycolate dehydrogenase [Hyphomicrobiales bacterium]|nr:Ureidoglycolate dehydrogenase [Hyphomicrobiales bacterium]